MCLGAKGRSDVIALTGFVMLVINPLSLFDLGAHLSFMATLALVFGAFKISGFLPVKMPKILKTTIGVSLAPFIFTSPLLWYTFQNISPVSLISNMLVINWIEILVVTGFFSTIIGFVYLPLTQIINNFSLVIMQILNKLVDFLANLPFAIVNISQPYILVIFLLYFFIFAVLFSTGKKRKKYFKKAVIGLAGLVAILIIPGFFPGKYLKVTFLDVGQGDSALIETPGGKTVLIDGGDIIRNFRSGETIFDSGKRIIFPALKAKGINKLDLVITTHFHKDHIGGIPFLLKNIVCGTALDNGRKDHIFYSYKKAVESKKISKKIAHSGLDISLEKGINLNILHPFVGHYPHILNQPLKKNYFAINKNNNSVVCRLSYGKIDFLFTGDLEKEKEIELVHYYPDILASEVLKVGHHGSYSSSAELFLDKVKPFYAVISCGKKNRFRHPSKSTLFKLKQRNIKVLRTDEEGAIEFVTDGRGLWYKTY